MSDTLPEGETPALADPRDLTDPATLRRNRLHDANNRLAAIIMNLAFARATLSACPAEELLTPLERSDLTVALAHAAEAANQLHRVIGELG